jgi:hypothetical protein
VPRVTQSKSRKEEAGEAEVDKDRMFHRNLSSAIRQIWSDGKWALGKPTTFSRYPRSTSPKTPWTLTVLAVYQIKSMTPSNLRCPAVSQPKRATSPSLLLTQEYNW